MSPSIDEIVDLTDLEAAIEDGYVSRRHHDEFPELAILNYTDKCQFDGVWTPTTKVCRGLIYNTQTGQVLARAFSKFFNFGDETNGVAISPDTPLVGVFDKMDGSLGIGYMRPDGKQAIATRGSFHSEQAEHATKLFDNPWFGDIAGRHTPLYEILYPENRIVVDYGDRDELVFLGAVEIATGEYTPGGVVTEFPHSTVREAVEAEPRPNAEGMVMWLDWSTPVKIKQDDYKALHKIISGLNEKEIWRQLSAGHYDDWVEGLPDEFYDWAEDVAAGMRAMVGNKGGEIQKEFEGVMDTIWPTWIGPYPTDREAKKTFALAVKDSPNKSYLFTLFDGGIIAPALWRSIEPKGNNLVKEI